MVSVPVFSRNPIPTSFYGPIPTQSILTRPHTHTPLQPGANLSAHKRPRGRVLLIFAKFANRQNPMHFSCGLLSTFPEDIPLQKFPYIFLRDFTFLYGLIYFYQSCYRRFINLFPYRKPHTLFYVTLHFSMPHIFSMARTFCN